MSQDKIIAAQMKIADILATLEKETGQVVDQIGIDDIDVTTLGDKTPVLNRSVRIELKRLPGTRWQ